MFKIYLCTEFQELFMDEIQNKLAKVENNRGIFTRHYKENTL